MESPPRRTVLRCANNGFAGVYFQEKITRMTKSDIAEMHDERMMLLNINLRRAKLQNAPLVINGAIFRESMSELVCENTQFNDCHLLTRLRRGARVY
jgi:hypothetical protein